MTSLFEIEKTEIEGLLQLRRLPRHDERGFFERVYQDDILESLGWPGSVAQINRSFTKEKGTVRGLHYQIPPRQEAKLVSCLQGEVFDVAVDLRAGSPTFLKWHGVILNAENNRSLLVPPGMAHGFQALGYNALVLYMHSAAYASECERGVRADDPALKIAWPLLVQNQSEKDQKFLLLGQNFKGIIL